MAIVMSKRNFHSEVDKFFESVEENRKKVVVCRDLGPNENENASEFYYRLPRKCRLWYNEVKLNFKGSSKSTFEDGGNDVQPEEKEKVKEKRLDEEKKDEKKEEEEKVEEEEKEAERAGEETTAITSEDPGGIRCVQVGSHQKMKVTSTSSKSLQIEQYGDNNDVSIKIDPKVKNNVRIVVNSGQLSKEDEDAITTDLKEDEGLEISVKSSGCTSLTIKKGSIIIEMDVEPGTNMDKEWLFSLFTLLFEERLRKLFPEGISLDVEVEKTWTVTLQEIESAKKSDLHALCVPKEKYDALMKEITELKGKIKESAKKSDLHALCVPKEKYDALFEENTELIGKIKAMEKMVVRRHPMSFPFEQYGEPLKEILELSRKMRETIVEDYPRSRQREKYEELLRENLELNSKLREAAFEDYPRSRQRENYEELQRENLELNSKLREAIVEDYPRSLQGEKYEPLLKKSIELSRKLIGFEKSRTGSEHAEEEFPKMGMRAGEKRYVTERPRSLKELESPVTEHPIKKGNVYRKDKGKWISESTPPLAVTTASTESQLEGASTKGGQDLPSQSK